MLFAAVKPSETAKTLSLLAEDTHFLLRQFSSNEKVKKINHVVVVYLKYGDSHLYLT
jgi:hypothetical protein